ncbi:hypothetical protein T265_06058 [Opisthorchis viverrini]|uniref:Uncharacterized protein n=1 Tax=Opisthorchis viverrini TaxID=6198 RepID=A0A074ZIG7_OPIVI|nr:hypothetical protein T265_06058 [Opisthorchis viverrini]KER26776.1 hypothetical protein T265_06058 [Opisthorchis viverrini]
MLRYSPKNVAAPSDAWSFNGEESLYNLLRTLWETRQAEDSSDLWGNPNQKHTPDRRSSTEWKDIPLPFYCTTLGPHLAPRLANTLRRRTVLGFNNTLKRAVFRYWWLE